jgi:hypothetical protein
MSRHNLRVLHALFIAIVASSVCSSAIHPLVAQTADSASSQSGPTVANERVYRLGPDISAPVLLPSTSQNHPATSQGGKKAGSALVEFYVEKDGSTSNIRVLNLYNKEGKSLSNPERDPETKKQMDNVVGAVKQYRFKSFTRKGAPVRVALTMEINFQTF